MVSNDSLKFVESRHVKISISQIFILFHVFIRIHKNNNYKTSAIFVNPVTYIGKLENYKSFITNLTKKNSGGHFDA